MWLRQQVQRLIAATGAELLRDGDLLQVLRSELTQELANGNPYKSQVGASIAGFTVEWDDPMTEDVVLRRQQCGPKGDEEVAVSAILAPLRFGGEDPWPRNALVKACIRNPRADSICHFDWTLSRGIHEAEEWGRDFKIRSVLLLSYEGVRYAGHRFSRLDPQLQEALKEYLADRRIGMELNSFLHQHLHKKEQSQYMNWLETVERIIAKDS